MVAATILDFEFEIEKLSQKNLSVDERGIIYSLVKSRLPKGDKSTGKILSSAVDKLIAHARLSEKEFCLGVMRFILHGGFQSAEVELKKKGVFRVSKYNFKVSPVKNLLSIYESESSECEHGREYLKNVRGMLALAPDIENLRCKIKCAIRSRKYFLKTILARAEVLFDDLYMSGSEFGGEYSDYYRYRNKESIVSACSYLAMMAIEEHGDLLVKDSFIVDESMSDGYYDQLNADADSVLFFLEAEIKVDFYGYSVTCDKESRLIVIENKGFEKLMCHGFTKAMFRRISQYNRYDKLLGQPTFLEFMDKVWAEEDFRDQLYRMVKQPIERIVVTAKLLEYGHKHNIFSNNSLFKDEEIHLRAMMDEYYRDDVLSAALFKAFTVMDILKIKRFFGYVAFVSRRAWERLAQVDVKKADRIRRRSVIPVMPLEQVVAIIKSITGRSDSDCEALINELSSARIEHGDVLDLQYNPIVKMERGFLVLPSVFSKSDIVRSLALSRNKNLSLSNERDHMILNLIEAFREKKFYVRSDFKFGGGEIDLIALREGHLFLFECKNPYHPVNVFELRNTYSHLKKGISQVSGFRERFKSPLVLKQFLKNLSIDPALVAEIHYGVINGNRALCGLREGAVTVFHANELISFIRTGEIFAGDKILCCWKGKEFAVSDLIDYMGGDVLSADLLAESLSQEYGYKFRNYNVFSEFFAFDVSATVTAQAERYKFVRFYDDRLV